MERQLIKFNKNWKTYEKTIAKNEVKKISNSSFLDENNPDFIAVQINLHKTPSKKINEIQQKLKELEPGHRFYDSTYFHITLKLFGRLNQTQITELRDAFSNLIIETKPFQVKLKGLNIFPTSTIIQVFDQKNELKTLHAELEKLNEHQVKDFSSIESENYLPHVAILSFDRKTDATFLEEIRNHRDTEFGIYNVKSIELVAAKTYLTENVYTVLERKELK